MATNIRANWVVEPDSVAEYDRAVRLNPMAIILAGAVFFVVAQATAIDAVISNPAYTVTAATLSLLGLVAAVLIGRRVAIARERSVAPIVRDIDVLRDIVVFDQGTVDDYALWVAAGIASEIAQLDQENDRLASASARTPAQEAAYAQYEATRSRLAEQALELVVNEGTP